MSSITKLLLLSILSISILAGCGGADERKQAYLEKARQSIAAGDLDKARIELKNVLQIDPKFGDAYYELGKIYEEQKDYRKAYGHYTKAAELSPDNFENQARLGRLLLLAAQDTEKATEKMEYILGKSPDDINGLLLKAAILVKNNKKDEALAIAETINQRDSGDVETATFLAALYTQKKEVKKATSVLESTLEKHPGNPKLTQMLARIYLVDEKFDKAESLFKQILDNHPEKFANYVNLAAFYNKKGDKKSAISILRKAIEEDPQDVDRQITLAKFIQDNQGNDAARAELINLIRKYPALGKLRIALGSLYVQDKQIDKAKEIYEKAKEDFPEEVTGVNARIALATLYIQEDNRELAKAELQEAIAVSPNDPKVNLLVAKLAIQDKKYEDAIIALRIVVKEEPANIEAYFLLAGAHNALGDKDQANTVINNAYENNRTNPAVLMTLAKYYAKLNDADKTEKIVDEYLAIDGNNYDALSMKVTILNKRQNFEAAKPLAQKLVKSFPDKPNGYIQSVPYLASEKAKDKAVSLLKEGYSKVKNNVHLLKLLTSIQITTGEAEEALVRVKDALTKDPDNTELSLLLAKVYLSTKDYSNAEKELDKTIKKHPENEEAYALLSDMYSKQGKKEQQTETLAKGSEATNSLRLSIALAGIYEIDRNYDKAIKLYEDIISNHPGNLLAMNNLASILSDRRNDQASLKRAKELADELKQATQPVILDTVGWIYYKTGDNDAAIDTLKGVVEKSPDIGIFNYHLGMAYKAAGDKENARKYLEKSLDTNKDFEAKDKAEAALKTL